LLIYQHFSQITGWLQGIWSGAVNGVKGFVSSVSNVIGGIGNTIVHAFDSAISFITGLPGKMLNWGKDMIQNLINGIKSGIDAVGDAVKGVADKISSFLHFSVPDVGPLADFDKSPGDMINLIANGLNAGVSKVKAAANNVAAAMSLASGGMQTGTLAPQLAGAGSGTSQASTTNVVHSGTIHVEGVSDSGQLAGAVDIIIDQLRREARI
jgi:phage-related protein